MEARQRTFTSRTSKIPARVRTASVPRLARTSETTNNHLNEKTEEAQQHLQKRVRRKWKSFNFGKTHNNNNSVLSNGDVLSEWRDELAEEQGEESLLQFAADLLAGPAGQHGSDELTYRREQALYWLCKAAERGSVEARLRVSEMLHSGLGISEINWSAVKDCSSADGLTRAQLIARRIGRKTFRRLELGRGYCTVGQIYRLSLGKDVSHLDADDVRQRLKVSLEKQVSLPDLTNAGCQYVEGQLPDLDLDLEAFRGSRTTFNQIIMSILVLIIIASTYVANSLAILPLLAILCSLWPIYMVNWQAQRDQTRLNDWTNCWAGCHLPKSIVQDSKSLLCLRTQMNACLFVLFVACVTLEAQLGFYLNVILAFGAFLATLKVMKIPDLVCYLLLMATYTSNIWMYYCVPAIPDHFKEIYWTVNSVTCIILVRSAWKRNQFQLLWPAALSHHASPLWMSAVALSVLAAAITKRINRLKCLLTMLFLLGCLLYPNQLSQPVNLTNRQISWNEFSNVCPTRQWSLSVPEQLGCLGFLGRPVQWEGTVAGIKVKPVNLPNISWLINTAQCYLGLGTTCLYSKSAQSQQVLLSHYGTHCGFFGNYQCKIRINMWKGSFLSDRHTINAIVDSHECHDLLVVGTHVKFKGTIQSVWDTTVHVNHVRRA